ncbi:MAG: hypothetical protein J6B26_05610 [Agathobacter sp.]|nr:hypothetical protein [Agathobacter sp.]
MRKNKIEKMFFTVGMLSLLLSGCQKAEVDYEMNSGADTQAESKGQETSPLGMEEAGEWTEDFSISEDKNVSIHATVKIPDVEQMSVAELQNVVFDEEYKKKVIQELYGTSEVYANEQKNWSKDRWQTLLQSYEISLELNEEFLLKMKTDSSVQYDAESIENCEKQNERLKREIEKCTKELENAPDTAVAVTDFSGESYYGKIDSLTYEIGFYTEEDYADRITFSLIDQSLVCPEELKDARELCYGGTVDQNAMNGNLCTITEEEAKKQAEKVLGTIGWTEFIWQDTKVLEWSDYEDEDMNYYTDGYYLTCEKGAGNLVFGDFDTGYELLGEERNIYNGTATICINDHGIIELMVEDPVYFVQETENVSLLSLDTVKGIIKKELSDNPDQYFGEENTLHFGELELNYLRIEDENRAGYFSYVPAWRLCYKMGSGSNRKVASVPVFVNAIDGSIINLEDIIQVDQ